MISGGNLIGSRRAKLVSEVEAAVFCAILSDLFGAIMFSSAKFECCQPKEDSSVETVKKRRKALIEAFGRSFVMSASRTKVNRGISGRGLFKSSHRPIS